MPYQRLRIFGDGDCLFYCLAVLWSIRKQIVHIGRAWLDEVPNVGQRPSYQGKFKENAWQARRTIANWLALSVFDRSWETLSKVMYPFTTEEQIRSKLGQPDFSRVDRDAFLACFPKGLRKLWDEDQNNRPIYAAFFIIWYWRMSQDWFTSYERQLWRSFGAAFKVFDCDFCIWGDDDLAIQAAFGIWGLEVEVLQQIDPDLPHNPDVHYVLYSADPNHFDPVVWYEPEIPQLPDHHYNLFQGTPATVIGPPGHNALSRNVPNTLASPLVLGLLTWNVNHLGRVVKKKNKGIRDLEIKGFVKATGYSDRASRREKLSKPVYEDAAYWEEESSADTGSDDGEDFQPSNESKSSGAPSQPATKSKKRKRTDDDDPTDLDYQEEIEDVEEIEDEYDSGEHASKNKLKLAAINQIVRTNIEWLDLLALNEVNLGVEEINSDLYSVHRGPKLWSVGPKKNVGQQEYYPLLITKRPRDFEIKYVGWFAVQPNGEISEEDPYRWIKPANLAKRAGAVSEVEEHAKKKPRLNEEPEKPAKKLDISALPPHRPVVVHQLQIDGKVFVNVGIIHTTPGGNEFERVQVYGQLEKFFQGVRSGDYDQATDDLWLICGDFYLFSEALIYEKDEEKLTARYNTDPEMRTELVRHLIERLTQLESRNKQAKLDQKKPSQTTDNSSSAVQMEVEEPATPSTSTSDFVAASMKTLTPEEGEPDFDACLEIIEGLEKHSARIDQEILDRNRLNEDQRSRNAESESDGKEEVQVTAIKDKALHGEKYFQRNRALARQYFHKVRTETGWTFAGQLKDKFRVEQPIWATNIHTKAPPLSVAEYSDSTALRLADFIVCTKNWQSAFVGLLHHNTSGVLAVDDEAVTTSKFWRLISDHFPVGGRFSTADNDGRVRKVIIEGSGDEKEFAKNILYLLEAKDKLFAKMGAKKRASLNKTLPDLFEDSNYQKAFHLMIKAIASVTTSEDLRNDLQNLEFTGDPRITHKVLTTVCKAALE